MPWGPVSWPSSVFGKLVEPPPTLPEKTFTWPCVLAVLLLQTRFSWKMQFSIVSVVVLSSSSLAYVSFFCLSCVCSLFLAL